MRTFDVVFLVVVLALVVLFSLIIARQRHMLRGGGGFPMGLRSRSGRWLYGVGRYAGDELQWSRALGIGSRASRVLRRGELTVLRRRPPGPNETNSIPATAAVIECEDLNGPVTIALGESALTGFVSWLESAPKF